MKDIIEPSAAEKANGWTAESLRAYLAERERAASKAILRERPPLPKVQNSYSPHRWRR